MCTPNSVTLIITTYNSSKALELALFSLINQTLVPYQVVVADDGSGINTRPVIHRFKKFLNIEHVWQPDVDFRAARARNLALCRSKGEYIIFVDGDCVLPPTFIAAHLKLKHEKKIIAGSRYLLQKNKSEEFIDPITTPVNKSFSKGLKFLSLPSVFNFVRDLRSKAWRHVRSCNMSLHKSNALQIAGFDEAYRGWGREDSDFIIRLLNNNVTIRSGRLATTVLHLWHKHYSRSKLSSNDARLEKTLADERILPIKSCLLDI